MNPHWTRAWRFLLLAWLLPATCSYVAYFGYSPDLSGSVFSEAGFSAKYDHGIYRYRVLGIELLRFAERVVETAGLPLSAPKMLQRADPTFTKEYYSAFFYMNTLLLCLTSSVLFIAVSWLRRHRPGATPGSVSDDLVVVLLVGMMVFSQYVVVPYDVLSYLFLALAAYLLLCVPASNVSLASLCAVVVLAALTRETAALILSLYAAVHFDAIVKRSAVAAGRPSPRLGIVVLTACFVAVYLTLRIWLGTESALFDSIRLRENLTETFSLVGGAVFAIGVALVLMASRASRTTVVFLVLSTPYWLAMFVIANPREVRLWVPVFLPLALLQLWSEAEDRAVATQ